ncbi:phosphatidylinositol N-acetylglucosaminyltransferase subunit Y-domain-containing protein [Umbelopsis sp. PMI_123]|nr:phosphatidylinositol N-acetylglucosaminyltransferase subunit Y-domain-containing protein [Umbelopsis sp. PMI_123]
MESPIITLSPIDEIASSTVLTEPNRKRKNKDRPTHRPQLSIPQPIYTRRMTVHMPETAPDSTYLWGYALLAATFATFTITAYTAVGTYFVPYTGYKILDAIKDDDYYCLLVPITSIVCIYFIVWNWMGMKFFRHN